MAMNKTELDISLIMFELSRIKSFIRMPEDYVPEEGNDVLQKRIKELECTNKTMVNFTADLLDHFYPDRLYSSKETRFENLQKIYNDWYQEQMENRGRGLPCGIVEVENDKENNDTH